MRQIALRAAVLGIALLVPLVLTTAGRGEDPHQHGAGAHADDDAAHGHDADTPSRDSAPHDHGEEADSHGNAPHDHDAEASSHSGDAHGHDDHGGHAFSVAVFERHGVTLATAGSGEVDVGVDLPGEVRPNGDRIAHLAPRFPGVVREVRAHVGDNVAAGDVLAVIEGDNLVTYQLRARFAGTVIDKHITPGEAVARDRPAFIVVDLSTVWVDITVYQSVLPRLRAQQLVVIAAGADGPRAEGAISYLSPVVDQTTRTATARVVLPNVDGLWRPGLFVTATIFEPVYAAVVVPRRALHTIDGKAVIFAVEGDEFVPRPVSVGATGRSLVEISDGLAAGERFADEGSFLVKADLSKGEIAHEH